MSEQGDHITDLSTAFSRSTTSKHHGTTTLDWAMTFGIIIGAAVCAAAIISGWVWLGILGAVVVVVCAATALASGMFNRTEDYPEQRVNA